MYYRIMLLQVYTYTFFEQSDTHPAREQLSCKQSGYTESRNEMDQHVSW